MLVSKKKKYHFINVHFTRFGRNTQTNWIANESSHFINLSQLALAPKAGKSRRQEEGGRAWDTKKRVADAQHGQMLPQKVGRTTFGCLIVACHRNWRPATCLCIQLHQNRLSLSTGGWKWMWKWKWGLGHTQTEADKWICYKLAKATWPNTSNQAK